MERSIAEIIQDVANGVWIQGDVQRLAARVKELEGLAEVAMTVLSNADIEHHAKVGLAQDLLRSERDESVS